MSELFLKIFYEPYVDGHTFFNNYYGHFIAETFPYLVKVVRINSGIVWRLDLS